MRILFTKKIKAIKKLIFKPNLDTHVNSNNIKEENVLKYVCVSC